LPDAWNHLVDSCHFGSKTSSPDAPFILCRYFCVSGIPWFDVKLLASWSHRYMMLDCEEWTCWHFLFKWYSES